MGFSFVACHPAEMFGEEFAQGFIADLQSQVPGDVPVGYPDTYYSVDGELGYSWWERLQAFAKKKMGKCPNLLATDAWQSLYLDMTPDQLLYYPNGSPAEYVADDSNPGKTAHIHTGWWSRLLHRFCFLNSSRSGDATDRVTDCFSTRAGEPGVFRVGNLRGLFRELSELLHLLDINADCDSVEALLAEYRSDDHCEDDPEIQCLCHAWLTADFALRNGCPLWLIK